ncbi:MAG: hypothetical protein NT080_12910 [Spirochaetes bacterium]|nr:hypothetical protein [Spirochaetota bacterium]
MKPVVLVAFLLAIAAGAYAQTQGGQAASQSGDGQVIKPEPYQPEEFPPWLRKIGRFEVIAIGSFPVMYFYSSVGYDIDRWARSGFDRSYAPWPFKNEFSYRPSAEELTRSLLTAGALSLGVAAIDFIVTGVMDGR